MQRNSYFLRATAILLILALLILGPVLLSGASSLRQAKETTYPAQAARLYETAAQRLPWRTDLWERAGISAQQANQPEEAIRSLTRSESLSSQGWLTLGLAYLQTDQPEPALQAFEKSLKLSASAQAYAGIAQIQRGKGDLQAERSALENQLLLMPQDAAAQYRLGLLLSLLDINSALTHFQLASQLDPEYGPVYETLRSTLNLAELSPTESGRLVILGRGLGLVGEWALATEAFQSATRVEAGNAEAWAWLGEAKQHLGQDAGAELDQALALDSHSVVVHALRGLYWKRVNNYQQALDDYQAAASIEPENPAWKASLGEAYLQLGDLVLALSNYQHATELAPNDSTYWRLLAVFCIENGVQVEDIGLPAAQKSVDLAPEDPQALDALGWAQFATGRYYTAEQTLLSALELAPDTGVIHLHLAMVYLQTGNQSGAQEQLQRVIAINPNDPLGQKASLMLKQYFP